jgi:hypothetical protein
MLRASLLAALVAAACTKSADSRQGEPSDPHHATVGGVTVVGAAEGAPAGDDPAGGPSGDGAASPTLAGTAAPETQPRGTGAGKPAKKETSSAPAPTGSTTFVVKRPSDSWRDKFQITVDGPASVAAGSEASFSIRVDPATGYKINYCEPHDTKCTPYKVKLTLDPPTGVEIAKTEIAGDDLTEFNKERLVVGFRAKPTAAGDHAVPGVYKFAVCTVADEGSCIASRVDFQFAVTAK